jgi:glutamate--cysteine ligase
MTTMLKTNLDIPVTTTQDLIDYLARGARPPERWGIGTEMEKLVVDAETGEAASYPRIETLLQHLEQSGGWRPVREEGHLIALLGESSSITLEPGGQLELSGQLCPDLHCCHADFSRHIEQIVGQAQTLGLAFLGLGVQPFTPLEHIEWLPKARYRVMGPYMLRTGDLGQAMMKQSAGLQVNLDYADETDCIDKLRLSIALTPLLYALFANSPVMAGRPTGFLTTRGEIWARTDPDRTGLLPQLFQPEAGFATYVEYALDVPMYFIFRDGRFLDMTGERFPFRRYLATGFADHRATLADWDLHLSTLFPEARLRPQIEVRPADSLPPHLTLAVGALLKGILYDRAAREETWSLFRHQRAGERAELCRQSWRLGLKTPVGSRSLREVALEVLASARGGLRRQRQQNQRGLDEAVYLEGIEEIAESGVTLAERLLARWRGSRREKVAILLDHCSFRRA